MIKAFLVACVAAVAYGDGLVAPLGHVAYGNPYVNHYGNPYGYGAWNHWNPYGGYPAQPAIASQSQNIIRTPFNLGQISTYSKAIDTPFSSVRKADIRVSNPGLAVASPYVSHFGVAAPVAHVAPVAKVATTGGLLGVAYSAAPAVSHMTYSNGLGLAYSW
ncbi:pupal cuticle protein c1 domain-containing protein [Phthorimaea operculella]|nr:pupal cuticle protein c1 domain-containing protein [Phthorimaea operculella]